MKRIGILIIIAVMLFTNLSFAEPIDIDQMDFFFGKARNMSDFKKDVYRQALNVYFDTEEDLEDFKTDYKTVLDEDDIKVMESKGITHSKICKNIDGLKTWDRADRYKLIKYGLMEDQSEGEDGIVELNKKYTESSEEETGNGEEKTENNEEVIAPVEEIPVLPELDEVNKLVLLKENAQGKGLLIVKVAEVHPSKVESFKDLTEHWSKDSMGFLINRGILSGKAEGVAAPDDVITKAEVVSLAMRLFAVNTALEEASIELDDVQPDAWYYNNMMIAKQLDIIQTNTENQLLPNTVMTRSEIVDMLVRIYESYGIDEELNMKTANEFSDFESVPEAYKESLEKGVALGIIRGFDDKRLAPNEAITRAQMAVMLNQLYSHVINILEV